MYSPSSDSPESSSSTTAFPFPFPFGSCFRDRLGIRFDWAFRVPLDFFDLFPSEFDSTLGGSYLASRMFAPLGYALNRKMSDSPFAARSCQWVTIEETSNSLSRDGSLSRAPWGRYSSSIYGVQSSANFFQGHLGLYFPEAWAVACISLRNK